MPMSQSGLQCLMSVSGERSNSMCSSSVEQALVDVEEGHVAAEAAGQRGGGDLQLFGAVISLPSVTVSAIGALS
jgi:hypothetical protein